MTEVKFKKILTGKYDTNVTFSLKIKIVERWA